MSTYLLHTLLSVLPSFTIFSPWAQPSINRFVIIDKAPPPTTSLCWKAVSINSQQTFLSRNWHCVCVFACLRPRPAGGIRLPYADTLRAFGQLRVIEARSICTRVIQMTVNNTLLMTVGVCNRISSHHFSCLVKFPKTFALVVTFWRENVQGGVGGGRNMGVSS